MLPARRSVLKFAVVGVLGSVLSRGRNAWAQSAPPLVRTIQTPILTIGFEESGNPRGFPVILLHGFPDDARAWDQVVPPLANDGCRVIVPYLRGHGLTRFRDATALRTGEQAALGQDLIDLVNALGIERFAVAGYDWGGRAACIVAALHPERVRAAAIIGGYTIQDTLAPPQPAPPERERALWYQWYFNTERGRAGLEANRRSLCRLLWETWSPTWKFADETFSKTAVSFNNPDFVDVAIHSYRHRNMNAPGEARFTEVERLLSKRPKIEVPAFVLYGAADGVAGPPTTDPTADRINFPALVERRVVNGAGHFLPRENPDAVSSAILQVLGGTR